MYIRVVAAFFKKNGNGKTGKRGNRKTAGTGKREKKRENGKFLKIIFT
jgi:hypothetical protein